MPLPLPRLRAALDLRPDTWGPRELIPLLRQYEVVLILTGYEIETVTSQAARRGTICLRCRLPVRLGGGRDPVLGLRGLYLPGCHLPPSGGSEARVGRGRHPPLETLRRLGISSEPDKGWLRASFVFLG